MIHVKKLWEWEDSRRKDKKPKVYELCYFELCHGFSLISILLGYRLWNTISCLFTWCIVLKWSAQKTTEACDWVIGTHISDK